MEELDQLLDMQDPLAEDEAVDDVGLSDDDLAALCEEEYTNAKPSDIILNAQKLALQQYFLDPDGNEVDGSSQVQSSDVRDNIESALPILMDMFLSSESPVMFKPSNEKDIDQAEQETIFCQYVLNTQNAGMLILLQWIKDALLLKNGYVKCFWDAKVDEEREDYDQLTEDEYSQLLADDNYEVLDVAEGQVHTPMGPLPYVSVKGKRKSDAGQVRIVNIPTDHVRISASWNSIDLNGCPYVCHEETCTRSDLLVDGFDPEVVEALPAESTSIDDDTNLDRFRRDDNGGYTNTTSSDPSRDLLTRYEHYIRADRDGDGITELLKVTIIGGNGGTVIDVSEVDGHAIIATTPYVIPHSPYGMSLAEMMSETQKVKTAILRQVLDNLYLSNQPGLGVDVTNLSNPEVLSEPRVGMILLKKGPNAVAEPIAVPFMAEKGLLVMQAMDSMAEMKTGLSAESTGLNAEALTNATNFVGGAVLNIAQLRMKLVMSTICETGFKPLMLRIRELAMKHMTKTEMVQLGGKWVEINPRNWREKRNTQVRIGVGTVQKAERTAALNQILSLQKDIVTQQGGVDGPFVTKENIYNSLRDVERMTGTTSNDRYFSDPAKYTPPAPPPSIPDQALEIEQAKLAEKAQKDAADTELKAKELNLKERELGLKQDTAIFDRASAAANGLREITNVAA